MPPSASPTFGANRTAAEETIAALSSEGMTKTIDSARIAALRTLASAVDLDPANASLWREYRAAEVALRGSHDSVGDEAAAFIRSLQAKVGDEADEEPKHARGGRRSRS